MEARVHKHLSSFLSKHLLQDAVSNIDEIVLSYLLGVLDLIGQGEVEDCFDLEDVTDMMNAYLPGFEQISRSIVMEWMFNLAAQLKEPEGTDAVEKEEEAEASQPQEELSDIKHEEEEGHSRKKQNSFPRFEYTNNCTAEPKDVEGDGRRHQNKKIDGPKPEKFCSSSEEDPSRCSPPSDILLPPAKNKQPPTEPACRAPIPPSSSSSSLSNKDSEKELKEPKSSSIKRKKRYLSCSSQESQEDAAKSQVEVHQAELDDRLVRELRDMFPDACSMEAKHCLHLSNGDLNGAAQLIMDRQEIGQAITPAHAGSGKNSRKSKKVLNAELDDDSIKSSLIEKYSFYDAAEEKRTHKPPPLKNEAKKLVRYRDGQIVSMKGERFSEIKKT